MKIKNYPYYRVDKTTYFHAGRMVDLDLQGGLEDLIDNEIDSGTKRIVVGLNGMRFFHSTLAACLLNSEARLRKAGGEMVIAGAPEFVKRTMQQTGVSRLFIWVANLREAERISSLSKALEYNELVHETFEKKYSTNSELIG
ncbi:MAG: STAS domain-containing protein [Candidatus Electryonea clarkiae]|nr:STAS domain-containing protein [Candidatus Electryonea clarkiae]MDP8287680.1 STAS domain-containing protein [Candidatus Electryonea clarkiae]